MLFLIVLSVMVHLSTEQCLTQRDDIRKVSDQSHQALMSSELEFSTDLLQTVASKHQEGNVLLSPSSVFHASLLAYFISANHTEQSLKKMLHLANEQDKLDILGAYNVESYYQRLRSIKARSYQLNNANRLYVAKDLRVQYCMKVLFAEELCPANFQENTKGVVKKINQWVAGQTRNVIKEFLSEDTLTKDTQLVLVNAAYFKGKWKSSFNEEDSYQGKFRLNNGSDVATTMMTQEGKFKLRTDKRLGAEVLELPYVGEDISMFVLLPMKPSVSAVQDMIKKMDAKALQSFVEASTKDSTFKMSVTIPKFVVQTSLDLTSILESMGVGDLFKASADLSTLASGLSFSEATHKAKIRVDEKGTEAAAATGFIEARMYMDSFIADRPFVYTIFDKTSNIMLFFGIFNSP